MDKLGKIHIKKTVKQYTEGDEQIMEVEHTLSKNGKILIQQMGAISLTDGLKELAIEHDTEFIYNDDN